MMLRSIYHWHRFDAKAALRGSITLILLWLSATVVIMAAALALLGFVSLKLPSVASLKDFRPPLVTEVFSDEYIKIGEFYQERRVFVPLKEIPPLLIKAIIAGEDANFFQHKGISPTGIARAFVKNMISGEAKQGGSTITQQVAKGLLLTPERSIMRKVREAILAFKMEKFLTKEEILEIYLNQIYLGHSAYGVASAAQVYFSKELAELTLGEIAMLAGLTRAPSRDNPYTSLKNAREKQAYVLTRMAGENYITKKEKDAALEENVVPSGETNINLKYAPYFVEHVRRYVTEKFGDNLVLTGGLQIFTGLKAAASEAATNALRDGAEEIDRHQGYRGPLDTVSKLERPTFIQKLKDEQGEGPLDPKRNYKAIIIDVRDPQGIVAVSLGARSGVIPIELMRWARKPNADLLWSAHLIDKPSQALKTGDVVWVRLYQGDAVFKNVQAGATVLQLVQEPRVQGALVSIDAQNGALRAMVGGYDFEKSEFNRAVQARRQPGSAFKPFIYAAALDHGYTPASILVDAPITYDDPTTELRWRPKNAGGKFFGDTIFRDCLIESRNVPTIKIVQDIGLDTVIEYAQKMGITSPLSKNFSLALGSSGVTPLELVSAYTVFPNGGKKLKEAISIKKIVDRDGKVLERNLFDDPALDIQEQAAVAERMALEQDGEQTAIQAGKDPKGALPKGYVLSPQTAYMMTHLLKQVITFGTGRKAAAINRPAAGKTGTTNDNHDAWFVGFTPTVVTGVWIGFDDSAETLGVQEEGGRVASPIWLAYMQKALQDVPISDFRIPEGLVEVKIDRKTGKLASAKTKNAAVEMFRDGTAPKETTEEAQSHKSSQEFFLQE
jgi:penicillin-binding protein 1A